MIKITRIMLLAMFCLLMGRCVQQNEPVGKTGDGAPSLAWYIASYTQGEISKRSSIRVAFATDIAKTEDIGVTLDQSPIQFQPAIKGQAVWTASNLLEFKPLESLEPGKSYTAEIALTPFFKKVDPQFQVFKFGFKTIRRAMDIGFENLKTSDRTALKSQYLEGLIQSSDYELASDIEKTLIATQDGRHLEIKWQHSEDGLTHRFRIEKIERKAMASQVSVSWDAQFMGTSFQGSQNIAITPLNSFTLTALTSNSEPEQHFEIAFSDPLKEDQDLNGLIYLRNGDLKFVIEDNLVKAWPIKRLAGEVEIFLEPGIANILGYKTRERKSFKVMFEEIKPQLRSNDLGVIVPDSNGVLFPFDAVNLRAVDVRVQKIYVENIPQFLQVDNLRGYYQMERVGEDLLYKRIVLDPAGELDLKKWNRHLIDLNDLIDTDPGAIYRLTLGFRQEYSLYACGQETLPELGDEGTDWSYYYNTPYDWRNRDNPCHRSYFNTSRNFSRNVLASNLGLIAKKSVNQSLDLFITDLRTAQPISGVDVECYSYQNRLLDTATTDLEGRVRFKTEKEPFLILAKSGEERGYLTLNGNNEISVSRFDVGGARLPGGVNGFIYGERGVWRPGDKIFLTFVLHDKDQMLPANHPVTFELHDPRGQLVRTETTSDHENGFYRFQTQTDVDAPTGNYRATVKVGGASFGKTVKVETVMPNRLKIALDMDPLSVDAQNTKGRLSVTWLHGAVARNLKSDIQISLAAMKTQFEDFKGYSFDDPTRHFFADPQVIFQNKVGEDGWAEFPVKLKPVNNAPGRLRAWVKCKVFEPGGAFSTDRFSVNYDPYKVYAGVRLPETDDPRGALVTDQDHEIEIATVNRDGNPVSRKNVRVEIYRLQWRWWWDQDSQQITNYNSSLFNDKVASGQVSTDEKGLARWKMRLEYPDWGRFLVRVTDELGHSSGKIFYVDWPGWVSRSGRSAPGGAAMLTFNADKTRYNTGENITLSIPTGAEGRALVSIESGSKLIQANWINAVKGTTTYTFKATAEMAPNIYAHVTYIQPHAQNTNDLPIRLYGVIPIMVENPDTHIRPVIDMPDVLRPEETFKVTVSESSKKPMTYTLAVVDEGLLDLTRFRTPDPWGVFYAREALNVKTYDIYSMVLGAYSGEMKALLSIGGGGSEAGEDTPKANRFVPVVRYLGPFTLQPGEKRTHSIDMPRYVGSVKTMVVAGYDGAFGSAEKVTPVRKPLMLLGTLPRVLGPDEEVAFPLSVFAMEEHVRDVEVEIRTNHLLIPTSGDKQTVHFKQIGDRVVSFPLKVAPRVGVGTVKAIARAGSETAEYDIEIDIRNPNPFISKMEESSLQPGETWEFEFDPVGMQGTNSGALTLSSTPPMNLTGRMDYLINYPHGCVEQTTSSVFPQLYLASLMQLSPSREEQVAENIKAGIKRLKKFQLPNGSLSYWPGSGSTNEWGTNYAGHFIIEAKNAGYSLPPLFLERWVDYQKSRALHWESEEAWQEAAQAYRLYLLALAGKPQIGAMNRFREKSHKRLTSKWFLAAAYYLSGQKEAARDMTASLSSNVPDYRELSYTYGSAMRDQAMILETMRSMEMWTPSAILARDLARRLNESRWYSTQEVGYSLLALGKLSARNKGSLTLSYSLNDKARTAVQQSASMLTLDLDANESGRVSVENTGQGPLWIQLLQRGQPLTGDTSTASNHLNMEVYYEDLTGNRIDPTRLTQGQDFYAYVKLHHPGSRNSYKEMALTRIFPSGWEIHNNRMGGAADPNTFKPTYEDIRDDRIYSYFDQKSGSSLTFRVMLNASYQGRFYLPTIGAEAMYDVSINAHRPGSWITVIPSSE